MSLRRLLRFAGVSGAGLALDYTVYTILCAGGIAAGWANLVSAALAVTFVFVVSARRIFEAPSGFLVKPFVLYAAYQTIAVSMTSAAVGAMTALLDGRYLLGKTSVLPVSFTANYLFMSWLFATHAMSVRDER